MRLINREYSDNVVSMICKITAICSFNGLIVYVIHNGLTNNYLNYWDSCFIGVVFSIILLPGYFLIYHILCYFYFLVVDIYKFIQKKFNL